MRSGVWLAAAALLVSGHARAQDAPAAPVDHVSHTDLRVCADPSLLPFSTQQQEGFENKIAARLAKDLGETLSFTWFPDSQGFVRATLMKHRCDLIMGTVSQNTDVLASLPYYRTGYMLVTRSADNMNSATLGDPAWQGARFGLVAATPPTELLLMHGLMPRAKIYQLVVDTRVDHPPLDMLHDLADKKIDAALVWGPFAGYYIKHDKMPFKAVWLNNENSHVSEQYNIVMGARPADQLFIARVNAAITKDRDGIQAILEEYGIPTVPIVPDVKLPDEDKD